MNVRARLAVASTLAAALALVAGCSGDASGADTDNSVKVDASTGITQVDVADRKDAPVIEGDDLAGDPLSSADFAGKTLVVNVWGSWCGPCNKEAPDLQEVAKQYADKDVQFLGVNVQDNNASAQAYERRFGITYPSLDDYSKKSLLGFAKSLPAQVVPTTWIIDSNGKVAVRIVVDNLTASTLAGLIDDVQTSTA